MISENVDFRPNWVSAPGKTILYVLTERELSKSGFAEEMEMTLQQADKLLSGQLEITTSTADRLHKTLGASAEFWLNRDLKYREGLNRLAEEKEWMREIPWQEMIRFGWIETAENSRSIVSSCLNFFGVSDIQDWSRQYAGLAQSAAYRTTTRYSSKDGPVSAWLRQGHLLGRAIDCRPWNAVAFQEELGRIRSLTREKDPSIFIPKLVESCANCGVAVVILRAPSGCRHSGVTRFISADRALLLLSFRHLSDDHFWFTFFHEAGHLLLHNRSLLFVEGPDTIETEEEAEANTFASKTLIPTEFREDFLSLTANRYQVVRFARRIEISAGIVVGQLQHSGRLRRNQLNGLKRRFRWPD